MRFDFIAEIFLRERISEFDIGLDTIPRPYEDYDILVMSSNDTRRIVRFMKTNVALCNSVPKICVTHKMHPTKRAKLLKAGFDDVVDISQTNNKEMKSRIQAIQSRYTSSRTRLLLAKQFETHLSEVVDLKKITASQKRVLLKILSYSGRVCPVFSLQMAGSLDTEPITLEHLRVLIHHIRSALHEPFDITNSSGIGYRLAPKYGKDVPLHMAGA
jgi:DNA-binding response OmpR family regulator